MRYFPAVPYEDDMESLHKYIYFNADNVMYDEGNANCGNDNVTI